jgi:hypothetical protein
MATKNQEASSNNNLVRKKIVIRTTGTNSPLKKGKHFLHPCIAKSFKDIKKELELTFFINGKINKSDCTIQNFKFNPKKNTFYLTINLNNVLKRTKKVSLLTLAINEDTISTVTDKTDKEFAPVNFNRFIGNLDGKNTLKIKVKTSNVKFLEERTGRAVTSNDEDEDFPFIS